MLCMTILKSLDGGNKGDEHAKQIVQDVKHIFQALEEVGGFVHKKCS